MYKAFGLNSAVRKSLGVLFAFLFTAFNFGGAMSSLRALPEVVYAENEDALYEKLSAPDLLGGLTVAAQSTLDETLGCRTVTLSLFGSVPIKTAEAHIGERPLLVPCGHSVGISIYSNGVLIVGISPFRSERGELVSPAGEAGLKAGDVLLSVDGFTISTTDELKTVIDSGSGAHLLLIDRGGKESELMISPAMGEDGCLRIGAWVRDSTIGVGTLSFFDPSSRMTAALGHSVTDRDTGALLTVMDGTLVLADIIGVTRGRAGAPGELHGTFGAASFRIGRIDKNTELGIFGIADEAAAGFLGYDVFETSFPDEVHEGEAYIICSADGTPRAYSCRIVKTGRQNEPAPKGLVIEITDSELIGLTGGIVQGMSGSPIIQDGRLAGVVTHVLVNDPLKGYGAYAYWIYKRSGG